VPGLGIGAVPDVGHEAVALEFTAHGIINTCRRKDRKQSASREGERGEDPA
jgi:hypothetical protein